MATIHFYHASYMNRKTEIKGEGKYEIHKTPIDYKELEKDIKHILITNMNNNCILLDDIPEWSLIEIIEFGNNISSPIKCENIDNCDYIFGRIGRKKDINNIQKRNTKNLDSNYIERNDDEDIEVFTYFYLFFEREDNKLAIAYLTSLSAPNIRNLSKLISRYHTDKNRVLEISPIITKGVTEVLKKKDVINAFSYKIAVPSDKILGLDGIGLPEKVYTELENVKSTEIVVTVTAERNKNLLKDKNIIDTLRDYIYETHNSKVKSCIAKAKNNGQRLLPYHFLDNEFIEKVSFKYNTFEGEKRVNEVKQVLLKKYVDHRKELIEYMK